MNGERLKKARKACGYTQVSLAKALNFSKVSIIIFQELFPKLHIILPLLPVIG